jgi:hypothetical protein
MALAQQLTQSGHYTAIVLSLETGAAFNHDPERAQKYILNSWLGTTKALLPPDLRPPKPTDIKAELGLGDWADLTLKTYLEAWTFASPRPLVIFLDEIDSLENETLITLLRQLRAGYPHRPQAFPHALALIGVRDVRDYKVTSGSSPRLGSASPFNIKLEFLTLGNFSPAEIATLYQQHSQATGQIFLPPALERVFDLTQGQPWLVNAIARQLVEVIVPNPTDPITVAAVMAAKERLIQRQETHLDNLVSLLRSPPIQAVFEPMLAGQELGNVPEDDVQLLLDLGLCRLENGGGLQVANPIYQEIIPRVLAYVTTASLPTLSPQWLTPEGQLNPGQLLESFLSFWRQHGEPLLKSAPYHEIAPHLVMMAFLHRVVNGGGTLEREYAIGTRRMDLCLRYGAVTIAMELKVWRQDQPDPLAKGLVQLDRYLAGLGLDQGWLVIFDRRPHLPPLEDRTTPESAVTAGGRSIVVIRG